MSDSNQVKVRYIEEVTLGETPVDSNNWKETRYTSETLTASPETTTSQEIRSDRAIQDMYKVNESITGGFNFELSANTYDDFFEAVLAGTWTADTGFDTLEQGNLYRSYTIEKEFSDIGRFIQFKGMRAGTMSLDLAFGSIITGSVMFAGTGGVTATTSLVGVGSSEALTSTTAMNASSDVGSVKIDGLETDICINTLSFTMENNLRAINCIGKAAPKDQRLGTCNITGSAGMYLTAESFALYEKALLNGDISLEYTVTDGTNSYTFLLPRVKLSGDAPQSGGLDQDVMFTANFTALIDTVENTPIRITRTPNVV